MAVVESLAAGGFGVVRMPTGEVHLVAGVAPGDRVELRMEPGAKGAKKALARVLRVVEPGPDRVEPICPVASACGGCDWMFLSMASQAREHARVVHELLAHALGGAVPEPTVVAPSEALGYRSRARLHLMADRGRVRLGYHKGRSRELVEPEACAVLEPGLYEAARSFALLFAGARGQGEVSVAWGRQASGDRALVADLAFGGELPGSVWGAIDAAVTSGAIAGARVTLSGAVKPATFGDPRPVQVGFDGEPLVLPAGGFAQPSDRGAVALALRLRELARATDREVHELFAGAGTLTVALARDARVTSIELDPEAVACARDNLARRGLSAKLSVGDAETAQIPKRAEVVVLDPPRTGATGASKAIAKARPKRVVYVSCDPPTLARDARTLAGAGYAVVELETIELFPQTSHVETVVVFERGKAGGGERS